MFRFRVSAIRVLGLGFGLMETKHGEPQMRTQAQTRGTGAGAR